MTPNPLAKKAVAVLTAVLALLGTIRIVVDITNEGGHPHAKVTVHPVVPATIAVDGSDRDAKPDDPVVLSPTAQKVDGDFAIHKYDLRGSLTGPVKGPVAKLEPPFASDSVPGCRTRFLATNWSARTVSPSRVVLFWLHYTGGPDLPGSRADVDGLTAYGNSPAARVSWHFNMDKDGNCDYNVPLRYKAWTEANANSTGISIEVAGTGSNGYLRPGGVRQLRRIIADVHRSYPGIQLRLGGVSNCSPTRGGIVTHWMGGPCSGGHVDIKPFDIRQVIAMLAAASPPQVPAHAQALCREYAHYRREVRAHTFPASRRPRAVAVRNALAKHHYGCTIRGQAVRT